VVLSESFHPFKATRARYTTLSPPFAAEWGIGSMQKVYSQLNLPLSYDPELYGLRLNNIFRMSKFRVRTVGISQIRITFSGAMDLEASTSSACA
jgi:hypothetical protein